LTAVRTDLLEQIEERIRNRFGLRLPPHRRAALVAELTAMDSQANPHRPALRLLSGDRPALARVAAALTNPETYLFRHGEHFAALGQLARQRRAAGRPTAVLCAGVSTGEEAWSAAAVLADAYGTAPGAFSVVGWDLNPGSLATAQAGVYGSWSAREGLKSHDRWFERTDAGWSVDPSLRSNVVFKERNLLDEIVEIAPFDAIFFRNVAIYWPRSTTRVVVDRLARILAPEGAFFFGPSDPIELPGWHREFIGVAMVYRRTDPQAPRVVQRRAARVAPQPSQAPAVDLSEVERFANLGQHARALEILTSRGTPTSCDELLWLGILRLNTGEPNAATRAFRRCVYLHPERADYHQWLALALRLAAEAGHP